MQTIQIIDYALVYITMDIDGSVSAKEFVWIFYDHGSNSLPSNLVTQPEICRKIYEVYFLHKFLEIGAVY